MNSKSQIEIADVWIFDRIRIDNSVFVSNTLRFTSVTHIFHTEIIRISRRVYLSYNTHHIIEKI